jgi:hypothetical protein
LLSDLHSRWADLQINRYSLIFIAVELERVKLTNS